MIAGCAASLTFGTVLTGGVTGRGGVTGAGLATTTGRATITGLTTITVAAFACTYANVDNSAAVLTIFLITLQSPLQGHTHTCTSLGQTASYYPY